MRLVIGSDHAGWGLKSAVVEHIRKLGHEIVDVGCHDDRPVDFPDTPGFGFPPRLRVEISDDEKFERRTVLFETADDMPNPGDEPVRLAGSRLAKGAGRYVRVTATKLWPRT